RIRQSELLHIQIGRINSSVPNRICFGKQMSSCPVSINQIENSKFFLDFVRNLSVCSLRVYISCKFVCKIFSVRRSSKVKTLKKCSPTRLYTIRTNQILFVQIRKKLGMCCV